MGFSVLGGLCQGGLCPRGVSINGGLVSVRGRGEDAWMETATAAIGTYATGMHSCLSDIFRRGSCTPQLQVISHLSFEFKTSVCKKIAAIPNSNSTQKLYF